MPCPGPLGEAMRRRSRAGGKPIKTRRKTAARKHGNAPKLALRRSTSTGQETQIARLTRQLHEAQEQQRATGEILGVVARSRTDIQSVLDTVCQSAAQLCEAYDAAIWRSDGDRLFVVAHHGPIAQIKSVPLVRGSVVGRSILDKRTVHIADLQTQADEFPVTSELAQRLGFRTGLYVPLMREGVAIGVIALRRVEAQLFSERQVALLQTFADQAVIAIENARLVSELRESLDRQMATSEVLSVISSSPGELEPVFQAMLQNAVRICEAKAGNIYRWEDGALRLVTTHNTPPTFVEFLKQTPLRATANNPVGRMQRSKSLVHTADLASQQPYVEKSDPAIVAAVDLGSVRTQVSVPLLKENEFIGAITLWRDEVRPFDDKQITLVQNFAAQAVIAIENARLLNELRESLQQQTATADVLKVISRSTFDLQIVLNTLVESAAQLCAADMAAITRQQGSSYRHVASYGLSPRDDLAARNVPIELDRRTVTGRTVLAGNVVHVLDADADSEFDFAEPLKRIGFRTSLGVPLLREGQPIGVIVLMRKSVNPFTDNQIALVKTFADQAVIAIENVRLFEAEQKRTHELSESLQQQTATSELLGVISRSSGDLGPVFQSVLANAVQICGAKFGGLFLCEGDAVRVAAFHNAPNALAEQWRREPLFRPGPGLALSRSIKSKQVIQIADIMADQAYHERDPGRIYVVELGGFRATLSVSLVKDNEVIGAFNIFRQEPGPFTDRQITVATNFANQAIIAIENARLLNELRESLDQQTATSEVLRVISSSPGELKAVFQSMLENAVRICEATFGTLYLCEGSQFRGVAAHSKQSYANYFQDNSVFDLKDHPGIPLDRAANTKQVVHIPDLRTDQSYIGKNPRIKQFVELGGGRTTAVVPMLKEDEVVGAIIIYRQEVRPFTDKQIELVRNFAAQAVIAIENTRLLNELRESLEQQTATSEVLRVISSSPTNVQPVFDSIAESAVRLCGGQFSFVTRFDGNVMNFASCFGLSAEGLNVFRSLFPLPASDDTVSGRALLQRTIVEIADVESDAAYGGQSQRLARTANYRSIVGVPLLHEGNPIGAIAVARAHAGSFP